MIDIFQLGAKNCLQTAAILTKIYQKDKPIKLYPQIPL